MDHILLEGEADGRVTSMRMQDHMRGYALKGRTGSRRGRVSATIERGQEEVMLTVTV